MAMATNFWGRVLHAGRLAAHAPRRFGRIVNVVSVGGKVPPHLMPYTTSKFALSGLTKALRIELAKDGILVTGVYPARCGRAAHPRLVKGDKQAEYSIVAPRRHAPARLDVGRTRGAVALEGGLRRRRGGDRRLARGGRAKLQALLPNWTADARRCRRLAPPRGRLRRSSGRGRPRPVPESSATIPPGTRPDVGRTSPAVRESRSVRKVSPMSRDLLHPGADHGRG